MENLIDTTNSSSTVEICIALEDYSYGTIIKAAIPALNPLLDKEDVKTIDNKIYKKNIVNRDTSYFSIANDKCTSSNYVNIFIPEYMSNTDNTNAGFKGDKFAISFIGGDLDQPVVLRRL